MMNSTEFHQASLEGGALPRTGASRSAGMETPAGGETVTALTSGIAGGDDAAFNRFYDAYFNRIHHYLLAISGGWEEAVNDALQDTMMRAIRYMKPFTDSGALWNWLRRIARTAFIDQARKRKRPDAHVSLTDLAADPAEVPEADPAAELKEHLASSLDRLEPDERSLIEGKYLQGKDHETLAREFGTSPKAVESRLARIRKRLKILIMERLKDESRR